MGTLKDIYDIIGDIASRASSNRRKKEIEHLNSHVAKLEQDHAAAIAKLKEEHAAEIRQLKEKHAKEISRLKKQHAEQIARIGKQTLPRRNWVRNW
jgi:gas vesicle protein